MGGKLEWREEIEWAGGPSHTKLPRLPNLSSNYTYSFLPLCELCVGVTTCHSMGTGKGAGHGSGSNLMILGKGALSGVPAGRAWLDVVVTVLVGRL